VEDAVRSAFSQSHFPLEIILTDDCSSDRSYLLLEKLVNAYDGPHTVVLRRNLVNLGLVRHVNTVLPMASSDVIVLAAGDDVSASERTTKVVSVFDSNQSIMLVHSKVSLIDASGRNIGTSEPPIKTSSPDLELLARKMSVYIGATGAIRRSVFYDFGSITETNTYEDLILSFRARLKGNFFYIDEPLVGYRKDAGISTQIHRKNLSRVKKLIELNQHKHATLRQRSLDLSNAWQIDHSDVRRILQQGLAECDLRMTYYERPSLFLKELFSLNFVICARVLFGDLQSRLGQIFKFFRSN
jgi:glycosyltransferase involved in cell wall biosynthesis